MPASAGGGAVQIGPTHNVEALTGTQPWVHVELSGFPANEQVLIRYCENTQPLAATAAASKTVCVTSGTGYFLGNPTVELQTFADGTSSTSVQVPYVSTSGSPMKGSVPGQSATKNVFCDSGVHKCSVDVVVPNATDGNTAVADNATVFPIHFAPQTGGCSAAQHAPSQIVYTSSEPGIDLLLPQVTQRACATQKLPFLPLDTSQNGLSALTNLANSTSQTQIAFTEDPESPDQQQILSQGKYLLVPIAVTADVIAFQAEISQNQRVFPQASLNLTASMVAGLMSQYDTDPYSFDNYTCNKTDCSASICLGTTTCSLFAQENNVSGFLTAKQYGAYPRADTSGVTDAMTHWICTAPAASVPINGPAVTESLSAAQTFVTGLSHSGDKVTSCPVTDQFPSLNSTSAFWVEGTSPQDQLAKGMEPVLPPLNTTGTGIDVFAPMNWAWADYLGLGVANLDNGAQAFVGPTAQSVDAALADATANPDGTLTPAYGITSDANAYVMPAVIYAAVSLTKPTSAQRQAIAGVLNEILSLTAAQSSGGAAAVSPTSLPEGMLPLTPALTAEAQSDMKLLATTNGNGNGNGNGNSNGNGNAGPAGNVGSASSLGGGAYGAAGGYGGGLGAPSSFSSPFGSSTLGVGGAPTGPSAGPAGSGQSAASHGARVVTPKARRHSSGTPTSSPLYGPIALVASGSRLVLPALLLVGVLGVLLGGLLLLSRSLRQSLWRFLGSTAAKHTAPEAGAGHEPAGKGSSEQGEPDKDMAGVSGAPLGSGPGEAMDARSDLE